MSTLTTLTPNDLYEKAEYFHVNLADEPYLIPLMKQAVITPLPPQWSCISNSKTTQYRNEVTGLVQTSHPTDAYFLNQIVEIRKFNEKTGAAENFSTHKGDSSGWMEFEHVDNTQGKSTKYYYDFVSKMRSDSHPMALMCDQIATSSLDATGCKSSVADPKVFERAATIHTKSSMKDIETLEVLCFTSWWTESTLLQGEKKSRIQIYFSIPTKHFQVVLEDSDNVFTVSHLLGTTGQVLSAWDLHVGARIHLLGRWTTLMQPSLLTRQWLERHETKFREMQDALYNELMKYELTPPPRRLVSNSGPTHQSKSGPSLRKMLLEIDQLRERLAKYRPGVARRFILTIDY